MNLSDISLHTVTQERFHAITEYILDIDSATFQREILRIVTHSDAVAILSIIAIALKQAHEIEKLK